MDDLEGWQQTRWGMTAEEIIQAVGADNLRRFEETKQYQDSYADLTFSGVYIGAYAFDIIFQIDKKTNGLRQVLISYEEDPDRSPKAALNAAIKMLTEKFGNPKRIGASDDLQWKFSTTTIEIGETFAVITQALARCGFG